ncbi:MAG: transglycosylase domain-containing protein [Bdellovibrionales bacterium]|nr:transglycosylase domain-containing protein [Bdellovibrionales bacterium]
MVFNAARRRRGYSNWLLNLTPVLFVLSLFTVMGVFALIWSGYEAFREEFPDVGRLKKNYPVIKYNGRDKPFSVSWHRNKPDRWVGLQEISREAIGAVLVSEDWAFFSHDGYDANQIKEALKDSMEEGHLTRGASTITQQVVKNVFLARDRNLWRKLKELMLAVQLEDTVGKRRILETYLNIAEWGEGIFGIGAAASFYFHKAPSQLTAKEGAFLAMLLPSPKRYSQSYRDRRLTDYARSTIRAIMQKMEKANYLSSDERARAQITPLWFEDSGTESAAETLEPSEESSAI